MSVSAHPNHEVKGNRRPGKGRGASNTNDRGNTGARRGRKAWLVETYRADKDLIFVPLGGTSPLWRPEPWHETWDDTEEGTWLDVPFGQGQPACRCYRCGHLLTIDTMTVDKIFTKPEGGTYNSPAQDRRDRKTNIRPSCNDCAYRQGGQMQADAKADAKARRSRSERL